MTPKAPHQGEPVNHWILNANSLVEYDGMSFSDYKAMQAKKMQGAGALLRLKDTFEGGWKCSFACAGKSGPANVQVSSGRLVIKEAGQPDRMFALSGGNLVDGDHGQTHLVDFTALDDASHTIRLAKLPDALVSDPAAFTLFEIRNGEVVQMQDINFSIEKNTQAFGLDDVDRSLTLGQASWYGRILREGSPFEAFNFARRHLYGDGVDVHALSTIVKSRPSTLTQDQLKEMDALVDQRDTLRHPRPPALRLPLRHERYSKLLTWPARSLEAVWLSHAVLRLADHLDHQRWGDMRELGLDLDQLVRMTSQDDIRAAVRCAIQRLPLDHPDHPDALGIEHHGQYGLWTCDALLQADYSSVEGRERCRA